MAKEGNKTSYDESPTRWIQENVRYPIDFVLRLPIIVARWIYRNPIATVKLLTFAIVFSLATLLLLKGKYYYYKNTVNTYLLRQDAEERVGRYFHNGLGMQGYEMSELSCQNVFSDKYLPQGITTCYYDLEAVLTYNNITYPVRVTATYDIGKDPEQDSSWRLIGFEHLDPAKPRQLLVVGDSSREIWSEGWVLDTHKDLLED